MYTRLAPAAVRYVLFSSHNDAAAYIAPAPIRAGASHTTCLRSLRLDHGSLRAAEARRLSFVDQSGNGVGSHNEIFKVYLYMCGEVSKENV